MTQGTRSDRRSAREGVRWTKRGTWATIAGVCLTLMFAMLQPGQTVGTCNAVGDGAAACVTVDPNKGLLYANAVFSRSPEADSYVFLGAFTNLPKPPDYDPLYWAGHCEQWSDWAQANKLYAADGELLIAAQTGSGEALSIIAVSAQVFTAVKISEQTLITCAHGHGNGLYPGSHIYVDTFARRTTVAIGSDNPNDPPAGNPVAMPPASISLSEKDSTSVSIHLQGQEDHAYSGIITASMLIDGKPTTVQFGTKDRPYRWVPQDGSSGDGWDWNPVTKRWTNEIYNELGQG